MDNLQRLLESADMTENQFKECLEKLDIKAFIENPTPALRNAGINLKGDLSIQFVDSEEEAKALPSNVIPLQRPQANNEALSVEDLENVAGGGLPTYADLNNPNNAIAFAQRNANWLDNFMSAMKNLSTFKIRP